MIASRRRGHRLLVLVLAPIAVLLLVASVLGRAPRFGGERLPDLGTREGVSAHERAPGDGEPIWMAEDRFGAWPARIAVHRLPDARRLAIDVKPLRPLRAPDPLVYWTPRDAAPERLPDTAHLVGRLAGTRLQRFVLPPAAGLDPHGRLVIYSLAHQSVVASAPIAASPRIAAGSGSPR